MHASRGSCLQQSSGRPQPRSCSLPLAKRIHSTMVTKLVACASRNYYELLDVDPEASDDDIKAAFRRKALEVHPDVNKGPEAQDLFMQCKEAYETLSDAELRREYDRLNRLGRRIGFFQDVNEDAPRSRPFRWSQVGSEPEIGYGSARRGYRQGSEHEGMFHDDSDEDEDDGRDEEDGGMGSGRGDVDPNERLEELLRFMEAQQGGGMLRQWQRGGDPWGTSTSDMWHRQVERQTRDPSFGRGSGFRSGFGDRSFPGGTEWVPPGRRYGEDDDLLSKRQGWSAPGRDEWRPPGRYSDSDDPEEGRPGRGAGGPGRRGWGDDGGFRGKPL